MTNQQFFVVRERFLLDRPDVYQIQGLLPDKCTVSAELDGEVLVTEVFFYPSAGVISGVQTGPESLAKYAGIRVYLPEITKKHKVLSVYYTYEGERNRWIFVTAADLRKRQGRPQYFIEQEMTGGEEQSVYIRGWAASTSPVHLRLYDKEKRRIRTVVRRGPRSDVAAMFTEYAVEPKCGFEIEAKNVAGNYIYLVMRDREGRTAIHKIGISKIYKLDEKLTKYYDKAMKYLGTMGPANLVKRGTKEVAKRGVRLIQAKAPSFIADPLSRKLEERHFRPQSYDEWLPKHLPSEEELKKQRNHVFDYTPKISIVVPLYRTDPEFLGQLVDSVRRQTYSNWELCLSDGSGEDSPLTDLLNELEESDPRIKAIHNETQLRIAQNTNAAIEAATGDFIGFADHDDALTDDALFEVVKYLNRHRDTEMVYSDEDKMSGNGTSFFEPHFKPDYNPDLLHTVNYICHFLVVKRELLDRTGLLRPEFDGAQDYDLVLRCVENTKHIGHIPRILYHWRAHEQSTSENPESKGYAFEAGQRAIQAHFDRLGVPCVVTYGEFPGLYRTKYTWPEEPLVSILIPNKDHIDDLKKCIDSITAKSTYTNYEIIVIENNSTEEETFEFYKELEQQNAKVRVVYWEGEFNYSAINNYGAAAAKGDYYLLLNNDTEVINDNWIEELLGYCMRPDVGIVGARLYYGDDTIQHAGVIIGFGSIAGHAFVQQPRGATGYCHRIICAQDYSAVTAACMMVRKDVFEEVGGLSTDLAVAFNDVDFCLKVRHAGYLVVYNPYCELYHYESKSRGLEDTPEKIERFGREIATVEKHWPGIFGTPDPYYNPNLTLESQDFSLKRI